MAGSNLYLEPTLQALLGGIDAAISTMSDAFATNINALKTVTDGIKTTLGTTNSKIDTTNIRMNTLNTTMQSAVQMVLKPGNTVKSYSNPAQTLGSANATNPLYFTDAPFVTAVYSGSVSIDMKLSQGGSTSKNVGFYRKDLGTGEVVKLGEQSVKTTSNASVLTFTVPVIAGHSYVIGADGTCKLYENTFAIKYDLEPAASASSIFS